VKVEAGFGNLRYPMLKHRWGAPESVITPRVVYTEGEGHWYGVPFRRRMGSLWCCVSHGRSCNVGKGGVGTANLTTLFASAIARANDSIDGKAGKWGDLIHYYLQNRITLLLTKI